MQGVGHFHAHRHHTADLSLARAGEYGYARPLAHGSAVRLVYSLDQRISLVNEGYAFGFEIWNLEGKDYVQHIHVALELSVAPLS